MKRRVIVVGFLKNQAGEYLLCKMPSDHGVFPGQWGVVGGGVEEGEDLQQALIREVWEETRLTILEMKPLFFDDDYRTKLIRGGEAEEQYLIYLMFEAIVEGTVQLSDEWVEFAFVPPTQLNTYDLNLKTKENFQKMGLL